MIGHRIDLNDGLIFAVDDAGDIFVDFIFVLFWNKGLSSFDGENDVNVELGIGVSHDVFPLGNFSHVAPLGLGLFGLSVYYKPLVLVGEIIVSTASQSIQSRETEFFQPPCEGGTDKGPLRIPPLSGGSTRFLSHRRNPGGCVPVIFKPPPACGGTEGGSVFDRKAYQQLQTSTIGYMMNFSYRPFGAWVFGLSPVL